MLKPYITMANYTVAIEFAKTHTVAELKRFVKDEAVEDSAHSLVLYFSPAEYNALMETLFKNGAHGSPRGKEKALMKLVELAQQKLEK